MKRTLLVLSFYSILTIGSPDARADGPPVTDAAPTLIIAELFTSQGCSSCPPADDVLADLDTRAKDGVAVVPLAFHVDYWDDIGWPDPFASEVWSARQLQYARAAGGNRIYTPQLVVNGHAETVGSDRRAVRRLLAEARATLPAVRLTLQVEARADTLDVALNAEVANAIENAGDALELMVAVVDGGHVTQVERGENRRRTLRNEHVVRSLDRVARLDVTPGSREQARHSIPIDPSWRLDHLQVVLFVQDPKTRVIHGAARWVDNPGPV